MSVKAVILICLNLGLLGLFVYLLRKPNLLSYYRNGRWWLTFLSIAIITLMDELTSVFYAPAEAYRFIGLSAIVFIAFTAVFIHYMTTRLVEIAGILEHHGLIGGGVYSFSYLVLGPTVSFIAVSSIMVDYILTACISAVSAIENVSSFLAVSHTTKMGLILAIIWAVAGLNILGIKENARFVFGIFIAATIIFLNLIASGILALDAPALARLKEAAVLANERLHAGGSWFGGYQLFIASVASCILAYSGVESVLQTAGLVRSWREISKAYWFLAFTVGIVTPVVAALALSAPINFKEHEGDLITFYATMINGISFGVAVAALASFTLVMAVNTAFVASSELIERVAHRYGFHWLIATNRRQSLYRIHIMNAVFFSVIIFITAGSQSILADMYAIGLIASFCINMGSLLIYRYFKGTVEIQFFTSRLMTLIMWIIFVSCFIFLAGLKWHGTLLWAAITGFVLVVGLLVAQKRAPEIKEIAQADSEMEMILYLAQSSLTEIRLIFRRPWEEAIAQVKNNEVFITFYSPREGIPRKMAANHFRFPQRKSGIYNRIVAILKVVEYELPNRRVSVQFGWPMSHWVDRLAIGVMVYNLMRLPKMFPKYQFDINYRPWQPKVSSNQG
jgi:amino acid transporter